MRTTCVIAGGGPAGAMLALLLARAGVEVTLLEKHADFLRDFRGDTIHPSTLDILDELGLGEEFHRLPHYKVNSVSVFDGQTFHTFAALDRLRIRHPYIAFVPQWDFLDMLVGHARKLPTFHLLMEAEATDVITEDGAVRGLRFRTPEGEREIRAALTVAADGRHSAVRRAAGLRPRDLGAPMDVVWFRLSRREGDPDTPFLRPSPGGALVAIRRTAYWQLAYMIPKDGFTALREAGVESFRRSVGELVPLFADRVGEVQSFTDTSVLSVTVNRLRRWHLPGLLCIGDAAHAMSPIGGVGINLAIQDAVAAANLLALPMARAQRTRTPLPGSLPARVQRRRLPPTAVTQFAQVQVQNRFIKPMLDGDPGIARIPEIAARLPETLRRVFARGVAVGIRPEHVRPELRGTP